MESDFREYLKNLPEYCRLVPLGKEEEYKHSGRSWINQKCPIETNWRNNTYTLEQVC